MRRHVVLWLTGALALAAAVAARPLPLSPDLRPAAYRADLLVAGGSPAGVAAAVAAARQGLVVVLVEPRPFLGTVLTGAMLNMWDLNRYPGQPQRFLTKGIFLEVYRALGGVVFDPHDARAVLRAKVDAHPEIISLLETEIGRPIVEGDRIIGAVIRRRGEPETTVSAPVTVDATDDGDLAAVAGVPFVLGREASGIDRRMMAATLLFRLDGVDWAAIVAHALAHRHGPQPSGVFGAYAWGFRDAVGDYAPADERLSALDLNLGRMPDGTVWVNAIQVHDVDGTDPVSRAEGYARAVAAIPAFLAHLRARAPGFAGARLVEVAPELYIRETRHLQGLYTLTVHDILHKTVFWDRVAAASYPIDVHPYVRGEQHPYKVMRRPYTIPLRALLPASIDGMFLASRAFSATYQAAASARVVPTTMAMGEAAGVAAAVCVERRVSPHALAADVHLVHEVQRRLVRAGAVIGF
ncbi:MAG: FAD-dependent oxidoreductase [Armatimonadota bacterium]|nr:FAD-dependent oxidoreductase [Armatimonadota bacterium]